MKRRRLVLALVAVLPAALGAWLPWHGGLATALSLLTQSYTSPAAAAFLASDCQIIVSATIPAGGGTTITGINSPAPIPVGSQLDDGNGGNGTYLLYGTTVVAESGPQTSLTLTLSAPIINPPGSATSDTIDVTPPSPVAQWDWDPARTFQQPAAATGGTPQIVQFRNSAPKPDGSAGTPAAAQFTASIAGSTLRVTAVASGTITLNTPLYDTAGLIGQGTYISAQTGGTTGGAGTYALVVPPGVGAPSSLASEAMQTMGQAASYTSFSAAFPFRGAVTVAPGDVFLVYPAVYLNDAPTLQPQGSYFCGGGGPYYYTTTAGSPYVGLTSGCGLSGLGVGDFISDDAGNFGFPYNQTVAAINPAGCTAPCFQASANASVTVAAGSTHNLNAYRDFSNLSIEGLTIGGVRPVIEWSGNNGAGILYGINGTPGSMNNLLWNNIDLYVAPGDTGINVALLRLVGPNTGFVTFDNMRVGPGLNGGGANCLHSDDDYDGTDIRGTLNMIGVICYGDGGDNGQEEHAIYVGDSPNLTFNLTSSWMWETSEGHPVKSRAAVTNLLGDYLEGGNPPPYGSSFQGSISGNVLTISSMTSGEIAPFGPPLGAGLYAPLAGPGIPANTYIDVQTGGTPALAGSYLLNQSLTVASEAMTSSQQQAEGYVVDISCGGAVTMADTILTKNHSGPNENGALFEYGAEHATTILTAASNINSGNVLTFTTAVPADVNATHILDLTTPLGIPFGATSASPSSFSGDTLTMNVNVTADPGVKAGDRIAIAQNCLQDTANSLDIHNDTFVAFTPVYDGAHLDLPMLFFMPTTDGSQPPMVLPGDSNWTVPAWDVKNNEIVGFCPATSGGADSRGEYLGNYPWYGAQPPDARTGIQVVQALTEINQSFSPSPKYAPSGDTSNVGAAAYEHQAIEGLTRALATIGAVD